VSEPKVPPRVLVAPDSFKGTFSASEVAQAVASGVRAAGLLADELPLADGGEGTLAVLATQLRLDTVQAATCNPWGAQMTGTYGCGPDTAVIELAEASGFSVRNEGTRDPVRADTRGTGWLIVDAVRRGAAHIFVAAGGSATTDGGTGAAQVINENGGLHGAKLTVLTDVRTYFHEAAAVFGPQKGASAEQVAFLTQRLTATAAAMPRDPRLIEGSGAAGGFAGGMWGWFGAAIVPGADFVLDAVGMEARLAGCAAIVVGEGRLDGQTTAGKLVHAVVRRKGGVPAYAVVGSVGPGWEQVGDLSQLLIATDVPAMRRVGAQIAQELGRVRWSA
jgi:glycerate kinase